METNKKKCNYPILMNYFDENRFDESKVHIMQCEECMDLIIRFKNNLSILKSTNDDNITVNDENELAMNIEMIQKEGIFNEKAIFSENTIKSMSIIHSMARFIDNYENHELTKTPDFLKEKTNLGYSKKENRIMQGLIIKISDGLKLISDHIDNIFIIPDELTPVLVRSGNKNEKMNNVNNLNFVQIIDQKEIHYNIMKDGSESILLAILFEDTKNKPNYINLRTANNRVLSQQLIGSYMYFSKLKQGDYTIELKYSQDESFLSIPVSIVS